MWGLYPLPAAPTPVLITKNVTKTLPDVPWGWSWIEGGIRVHLAGTTPSWPNKKVCACMQGVHTG